MGHPRRKPVTDIAASVRQRLLNLARQRNEDFGLIMSRYATERLLYRLAESPYADEFILKGAQLFSLWFEVPNRATRDLDLLSRGDAAIPRLKTVFRSLCEQTPESPDGIVFLADSVRGEAIREEAAYEGVRIYINYHLAGARDRLQVDIGFGDVVIPAPQIVDIPPLLDSPAPRLKAYPRETVVAEKFEAMVVLGIANSRMRDFYDLWMLARESTFDGATLCEAIRATFERRRTVLPASPPVALSAEFYEDFAKQAQWAAFLRRGRLREDKPGLVVVIGELQRFLMPPTQAITAGAPFEMRWSNSEGWQPASTR